MGIEIVILVASVWGNNRLMATHPHLYSQLQLKQVRVQQQIMIEQQDINTYKILNAIKNAKQ